MSHDEEPPPERPSYKVGYGRPPREHQFKAGNRAAASRRRTSPSRKEIFSRVMMEMIPVTQRGRKRRMPTYEALIRGRVQKALGGDARAFEQFMKYWDKFGFQPADAAEPDHRDYGAEVRARLDEMARRMRENGELPPDE